MLGRIAVVAVAASLAIAPFAFATESPQQRQVNVTGTYHSNWDDVKLTQDGNRVYGTYVCCGGGTIEGKIIEGRTLRYIWRQPGGTGLGVWTIGAGRLDGTWGGNQSDSSGGRWDLVIDRQQPKSRIAQ